MPVVFTVLALPASQEKNASAFFCGFAHFFIKNYDLAPNNLLLLL